MQSKVKLTPQLILGVTQKYADAPALVGRARRWTYAEFAHDSTSIARHLRSLGVGPGAIVAVATDSTPEMVIVQFAIWLLGAAYVPLDPSYPKQRLRFVLDESGAEFLIASTQYESSGEPSNLVTIDFRSLIAASDRADLDNADDVFYSAKSDDLAYVIYTSGSTGNPKGVMIEHGALENFVRWHVDAYSLGPGSRVSQVIAPTFDMSMWEIWPTLACGASLHFAVRSDYLRPGALFRWLAEEQISLTVLPTPLAEVLLKEKDPPLLALRQILVAGEWLRMYPGERSFQLYNGYGPAETTIIITSGLVPPQPARIGELPSIGSAIADAEIYILDKELQPVPDGEVGEVFIGGPVLARGYINREDLTSERFLKHPFAPTGRVYRSGDLASRNADGSYAFHGRNDRQVKIRGYRIELGEIEAVLAAQPEVKTAVVLHREQRLIAFVVLKDEFQNTSVDLKARAAAYLPGYMLPTH